MSNWFKRAGYSYADDLLDKLWQVLSVLSNCKSPNCTKGATEAETVYRNLRRAKEIPRNQWSIQRGTTSEINYNNDLNNAIIAARKFIEHPKTIQMLAEARTSSGLTQNIQDTTGTGRVAWLYWENNPNVINNIVLQPSIDSSQPGMIQLVGLKLGNSKTSQQIQQQMGDWAKVEPTSISIRGTKEAWQKFISLAHMMFQDQGILERKTFRPALPSEKQFNPEFQTSPEEKKPKVFEAYLLNKDGSPGSWDVGNKKNERLNEPGIRLAFDPDDQMFWHIRDLLAEAGFKRFRASQPEGYFDVYESNAMGWTAVSKKLQYWGYDTKKLNPLIQQLTGKTIGLVQKEKAKKHKAIGLKQQAVENSIQANLFKDEMGNEKPMIASRFNAQIQTPEQFDAFIQQQYPGAFGQGIPETQRAAQKKGMYFIATRQVPILADMPGAGKSCQAMVGADVVREEGQKILVISPNILVNENWTGPKAKGPMFFCGHARESIAKCNTSQEVQASVSNPQVIWIVIPMSAFRRPEANDLAVTIAQLSDRNVFSSMICDEIQTIKNQSGNTYAAMQRAISSYGKRKDGSPYGIRHRVGLTGTPSDNDPTDIYRQMQLLRHPLLYGNKGLRDTGEVDWVLRLNKKGFVQQFLGGEQIKPVTLNKTQ